MKVNKYSEIKFKCPDCGSSHYGLYDDEKIYCHGFCSFICNKEEKYKFFAKEEKTVTSYETKFIN